MRDQRLVVALLDGDGNLRANDRGEPYLHGGAVEPHGSAELVVVGEGKRVQPVLLRACDEHLREGGAIEEGEAGMAVELSVLRH